MFSSAGTLIPQNDTEAEYKYYDEYRGFVVFVGLNSAWDSSLTADYEFNDPDNTYIYCDAGRIPLQEGTHNGVQVRKFGTLIRYSTNHYSEWGFYFSPDVVSNLADYSNIEFHGFSYGLPGPVAKTYDVTYNLTQCVASREPSTVTDGTEYSITFTPQDDYEFKSQPTATWVDSTGTVTKTAVDGVLTFTPTGITEGGVTITATATAIPKSITPTYELSNASVTPQPSSMTEGEKYTLTFTANSGYEFTKDRWPSLYYRTGGTAETQVDANESGILEWTVPTGATSIRVTATAYQITTGYSVTYTLSNATADPRPATMSIGTNYTIKFTYPDGYEWQTEPQLSYIDPNGEQQTVKATDGTIDFTPESDYSSAYGIRITAVAIAKSVISDSYGIVRVYKVTVDDLKSLETYAKNLYSENKIELTQYISSLLKFFAPIPSDSRGNLQIGGYDSKIDVAYVGDDIIEIDCGSVHVSGTHSNAMDYTNAKVELWLPFIGAISVDADRVMDSDVSLYYRINVLSGDCVAIAKVNEVPVATGEGNCTYEVPYSLRDDYSVSSKLGIAPQYMLDLTPCVVVRENRMMDTGFVSDSKWVRIGDMTGHCRFSNVTVAGIAATSTELRSIRALLEEGVVI